MQKYLTSYSVEEALVKYFVQILEKGKMVVTAVLCLVCIHGV